MTNPDNDDRSNGRTPSVPATREEGSGKQQVKGSKKSKRAQDSLPTGGMVGGPATESVPGSHTDPLDVTGTNKFATSPKEHGDGGEGILSGQPRETGGDRPK